MEFHQLMQEDQTVEELGLELQRLAKRAFPVLKGKDFDRLMKSRFFQALLLCLQRKLGASKPDESFDELFNHAHTTEQQYCEAAEERKDTQQKTGKVEKASTQLRKEQVEKASSSEKRETNKQGQGPQCRECYHYGHNI